MGVLPWEEWVPLPSVSLSRAQGGQAAVAVATLLEVERERGWVNLPAAAGKALRQGDPGSGFPGWAGLAKWGGHSKGWRDGKRRLECMLLSRMLSRRDNRVRKTTILQN